MKQQRYWLNYIKKFNMQLLFQTLFVSFLGSSFLCLIYFAEKTLNESINEVYKEWEEDLNKYL